MLYYSTNGDSESVSFRQAVMQGLAPDGGLYMPANIPRLSPSILNSFKHAQLSEIGLEIASRFAAPDLTRSELESILYDAYPFDARLAQWDKHLYALELFHGPTLAFKDFGARFMARVMGFFAKNSDQKLTILVATSGDTGSAVAHGFLKVEPIEVVLLYPEGRISRTQECQMATLGENIIALSIQGTFDDCQSLVKSAFVDHDLRQVLHLTSANSINIARLIPQCFYYFRALSQIEQSSSVVISVPSGNYGNLTAGLFAKKMGLPVKKFVAASNANDIVPRFLESGVFIPAPSKPTISNAMDVGNPSNFSRILDLYQSNINAIRADVFGASFSDDQTKAAIHDAFLVYKRILDPHGAVAYLGLKAFQEHEKEICDGIFLQTAHPAKFAEIVEDVIHSTIEVPKPLRECLEKPSQSISLPASFDDLKSFLLSHH